MGWCAGRLVVVGALSLGCSQHDSSVSSDAHADDPSGDSDDTSAGEARGATAWLALDAGTKMSCGVSVGGELSCWGLRATTPPSGSQFAQVAVSSEHACALTEDGEVTCWGDDDDGRIDPAPEGVTLSSITAGDYHYCGIDAGSGGTIVCWGWLYSDLKDVPTGDGFVQVVAGNSHGCARDADGLAVCWGGTSNESPEAPTGGVFTLLAANGYHTCGLTDAGETLCWGRDDKGQLQVPEGARFDALALGNTHSCGLERASGRVRCWGQFPTVQNLKQVYMPMAEPTQRGFVDVVSGAFHACGILEDGRAVCWGDNFYDQLRIP